MSEIKPVDFISDNMALLAEHGVIVSLGDPTATPPRTPKPKQLTQSEISSWGDDNDFPQKVIEFAAKSTELPALLDWKARALQGKEVIPVNLVYNEDKKLFDEVPINDPEINEFFRKRTTKRYFREAANDFQWFWNIFPDMIKSVGGDKIVYLGTHDASYCRWGKMDKNGVISKCYISANWPDSKIGDEGMMTLDVVDPYDPMVVEKLQKATNINRVVYPTNYPSPGKAFYQLAPWDSYRTSGWPEVSELTPKAKVKLMKFLLSAKFILEIPLHYWPAVYPDWNKKTPEDRKIIKEAKVKDINDKLTGVDNTGKTILVEVGYDQSGNVLPSWKIVPIEDKLKDGAGNADSREASSHLRAALSLDSALTGDGPGNSLGGNGGSDKRVALNIYVALQQPYREVINEPIYFIAEYNGWLKKYPMFQIKTVEIQLETLDKSHKTSKEVMN